MLGQRPSGIEHKMGSTSSFHTTLTLQSMCGWCLLRKTSCQLATTAPYPWYCIMMEILVNVGKIICKHLTTWIRHLRVAKPFPHLIKQFFIKACPQLKKSPQVEVKDEVCTALSLHCIISIHKKKQGLNASRPNKKVNPKLQNWRQVKRSIKAQDY